MKEPVAGLEAGKRGVIWAKLVRTFGSPEALITPAVFLLLVIISWWMIRNYQINQNSESS